MKNLTIFILLITYGLSSAQLSITSTNTNYNINFDQTVEGINNGTFDGSGFSSSPAIGQINSNGIITKGLSDSDMNFGDNLSDGDFARGSSEGNKITGGVYSFEIATNNFALGIQPGNSDFTPGEIILKVQNNTDAALSELSINYSILVLNNAGRSNSWNLSYSIDNITYVDIPDLDFVTPMNADNAPTWVNTSKNTSVSENISKGSVLYLKWTSNDINGSGSRDEIALDNIIINAKSSTDSPTLTPKPINLSVQFYPNPFDSQITIESRSGLKSIEIINTIGSTLLRRKSNSLNRIILNTEEISDGIYLVKVIETNDKITIKKLVKRP